MRSCLWFWPLRKSTGLISRGLIYHRLCGAERISIKAKSALHGTTLTIRYMALFFSFSIAGAFLPLILQAKGVDTQQSQAETYRSYVWICKSNTVTCVPGYSDL